MSQYGLGHDYIQGYSIKVQYNGIDKIEGGGGKIELGEDGLILRTEDDKILAIITNTDKILINRKILQRGAGRYQNTESFLLDNFFRELLGFHFVYVRRYKRLRLYTYSHRPYFVNWSKDADVNKYVEPKTNIEPIIEMDIRGKIISGMEKQRVVTHTGKHRIPKTTQW